MSVDDFDVGAAPAAPDKLESLHAKLDDLLETEEQIAQIEEDLKALKKRAHALKSGHIPELMDEIGMEEIKRKGRKVAVHDFVSGSLPKDPEKHAAAIRWLEEHEAGGLIKTDVAIAFGKSQHNEALSVAGSLREQGYAPDVQTGVHPQTLQAFARQRLKDGDPLDIDVLGLYAGRVVKIKEEEK